MPIVQCDIRRGRTEEQLRKLAAGLNDAICRNTGVPVEYVFLVIREHPGFNFVEGGEHVPDYVPDANGMDVAGQEWEARRVREKGS